MWLLAREIFDLAIESFIKVKTEKTKGNYRKESI